MSLRKLSIASSNSLNPGIVLQSNLQFFREVHSPGIGARDLTTVRTEESVSLSLG